MDDQLRKLRERVAKTQERISEENDKTSLLKEQLKEAQDLTQQLTEAQATLSKAKKENEYITKLISLVLCPQEEISYSDDDDDDDDDDYIPTVSAPGTPLIKPEDLDLPDEIAEIQPKKVITKRKSITRRRAQNA